MAQRSNLTARPNQSISVAKPILIRPLIIVPLARAMEGLFFFFTNDTSSRGDINKTPAVLLGLIVFVTGLWLGIVPGLDGTL